VRLGGNHFHFRVCPQFFGDGVIGGNAQAHDDRKRTSAASAMRQPVVFLFLRAFASFAISFARNVLIDE
jgi:hypothetical protein